ncbi:MAG: pyruvate, water dikinase regulatory protein [Carnobacterium sp.]|uniref:Putative pyruvate, phosphate dikinase regulatory protein n=1 Tax=Carnobacterium antarcticum TaxID=2126436 RepID=A0ABW4NLF0_9LACT|nr:pyruvate, water dikinase regulatory protein [Carnobacterium sp. CP1]ALV22098.1 ATP/GTP-binding protein [Carnobacterium sp. CP1]
MKPAAIYLISDSIGETGEQVVHSILSQYSLEVENIKKYTHILTKNMLDAVLISISQERNVVVFYTLVQEELRQHLTDFAEKQNFLLVDILGNGLAAIAQATSLKPLGEPGIIRKMDREYFNRIEAIEFSVRYDDGKDPRGILKADLVILGVSRTSKTPLSMYLANKNIRVANVPLFPESEPPKEIYQISPTKVIGLTNTPEKLNSIRKERLKTLGLPQNASYAEMNRILEELEYADKIMKRIGCLVIDVSNNAIEETANLIFDYMKKTNTALINKNES